MAQERTLSIIKPDAVAKNVIGEIISRFEKDGLTVVAAKMAQLSREQAEGFYAEHNGRPFFNDLVAFMTSGPVVVQVLEGENAIARNRELMGATNPQEAEAGTIRADFAETIDANAVPVPKADADEAFDAATCIGCGACVATCKNASAMLFVSAKVSQLALLPQGKVEAADRVLNMVNQMDVEGFGNCTNTGACEVECPKGISLDNIARMNREYLSASFTSK